MKNLACPSHQVSSRLAGIVLSLAWLAAGCAPAPEEPARQPLEVGELMGRADTDGYRKAIEPRQFTFPEDHGPHQGFRTEWWYFTGNLGTAEGRRFGYQLTFFRSQLDPRPRARESNRESNRESKWATAHAFMAHFAVTDVEAGEFHAFERFSREALGLSGARGEPLRVWLEDWALEDAGNGRMRLTAAEDDVALALVLEPGKPPVLQGDAGLSQKGRGIGNASYYYSMTRMPTAGSIAIGERRFEVSGLSWMDREWSTSALDDGQEGWDWFALQLDDGSELMLYQLRRDDGSADPLSAGTRVAAAGSYRRLSSKNWSLEVLDHWTSPATGARYPSAWRIELQDEDLLLEVRPVLAAQELDHAFRYWEGAVTVTGTSAGGAVEGRGYVELTGYE